MNLPSHAFEIEQVRRRLEAGNGGYEIVHTSPGLEVGVYVLVAPEPDRQQPHAGRRAVRRPRRPAASSTSRAKRSRSRKGKRSSFPRTQSTSSPAYEGLSVLVIFARTSGKAPARRRATP